MHLGQALVASPKAPEVVQPGEAALDHPAPRAQARSVLGLASCDQRLDPAGAQLAAVLVEVVASVGEQDSGPLAWATAATAQRLEAIDQRQQLGDVVAVAARQRDRERNAAGVAQQVVLGAAACAVDWRGAGVTPPWSARMWLPSIAASSQSILPAALSLLRSSR